VYGLTAIAFSSAWTLVFTTVTHVMTGRELTAAFLKGGAVWQFVWGLPICGVLVYAARAEKQLKERELAAAAAELQALRAQLNPHFLFNTLHSLTQLAREDPVATQEALERFGELMRYVLQSGRKSADDVALEEEIEFLRSYLALERLRLGERLRVVESIDPEALELAVPPLLLQPLVENAVRHGLAPLRNGGTVSLSVRTTASDLVIEVSDDGKGAMPDTWQRSNGLGLKAVARQLNARFPGASELSITSGLDAGFAVRLKMPACIPGSASG